MSGPLIKRANFPGAIVRKSPLFAKLAITAISLCLSLIIAEIGLRSFIPLHPRNPAEFRIPHPVLGWVLEPRASYTYQMPEATISITYNSLGWHDVEHTINKANGTFRVLVLGDSFMEAYSVDLNDAFHRSVEDLSRTTGREVEVINLGVASYGTLQEYLVFRDIGHLYKPDIVLLGFFVANDIMNNSFELESMLGEGRVQRVARPFLDPSEPNIWSIIPGDFEAVQRHYREERAYLDAQREKLSERILILRLARTWIRQIKNLEFLRGQESSLEPIDRESQDLALYGVNYCLEPAEVTRAWDTTERILARLKRDVEAIGSKLVVFTVPAFEEVSIDRYEQLIANIANPGKLCLEEATGYARLKIVLTKLDIELIDLLPDFRRVMRDTGIQLYRVSDEHWNPEGHALAAEGVVSELIERELLPKAGE